MPEQTSLILGAGSSYPYGFPTGVGLRQKILELDRDLDLFEYLARQNKAGIKSFLEQFSRSQMNSIDSFLAKNPRFTDLGKIAIAIVLLNSETEETLLSETNPDNWYRYLINSILPHDWNELDLSWLKIISFNYDRSLYTYLYSALKNTYSKSDQEVKEKLDKLDIFHVYGSLEINPRSYGRINLRTPQDMNEGDLMVADFRSAFGDLKVIPEGRNDEPHLKAIQTVLLTSPKICFLGFGFDQTNIDRINAPEVFGSIDNPKRVVATTIDKTVAEINTAKLNLFKSGSPMVEQKVQFLNKNCTELLRETLILR